MDRPGVAADARPVVRAATLEDADDVALVHWTSWRQTYAGLVSPERLGRGALERRRRQWRGRLARPLPEGEVIAVGVVAGEVVGWAAGGPAFIGDRPVAHHVRPPFAGGSEAGVGVGPGQRAGPPAGWEVQGLYLLREHHGTGLGQALLQSVLVPGPAFLWVAQENPRARAFYRRNGFVEDGVSVVEEHLGGLVSLRMVKGPPSR